MEYQVKSNESLKEIINKYWAGDTKRFMRANPHIKNLNDYKSGVTVNVPEQRDVNMATEAMDFWVQTSDGPVHGIDYYKSIQTTIEKDKQYQYKLGAFEKPGWRWDHSMTESSAYSVQMVPGDKLLEFPPYPHLTRGPYTEEDLNNFSEGMPIFLPNTINPFDIGALPHNKNALVSAHPGDDNPEIDIAVDQMPVYEYIPLSEGNLVIKNSYDKIAKMYDDWYSKYYPTESKIKPKGDAETDEFGYNLDTDLDDRSAERIALKTGSIEMAETWEYDESLTPEAVIELQEIQNYHRQINALSEQIGFSEIFDHYFTKSSGLTKEDDTGVIISNGVPKAFDVEYIENWVKEKTDEEFNKAWMTNSIEYLWWSVANQGIGNVLKGIGGATMAFSGYDPDTDSAVYDANRNSIGISNVFMDAFIFSKVPGMNNQTFEYLNNKYGTKGIEHEIAYRAGDAWQSFWDDWVQDTPQTVWTNNLDKSQWNDSALSFTGTVAQALPSLVAMIGGGIGVTAATKNPTLGMTFAASMGVTLSTGEAYNTYKESVSFEKGLITESEAQNMATLVGVVAGAIDFIPAGRIIRKMPGGQEYFERALTKKMMKLIEDPRYEDIWKQKSDYGNFSQAFLEGLTEATQEVIFLAGEYATLEDIEDLPDRDQIIERLLVNGVVGSILGFGTASVMSSMQNDDTGDLAKAYGTIINNQFGQDSAVSIDDNMNIVLKPEIIEQLNDEQKEFIQSNEFKKRFNIKYLAKKYPKMPVHLALHHEIQEMNPFTKDVNVKIINELPEVYKTRDELIEAGYDPNSFIKLRKGEEGYVEGQDTYKVQVQGTNIYSGDEGEIVLGKGASQDVYVEEVVEVLYKKLGKLDPKLLLRINQWIQERGAYLDSEGIGGPRGIELFSKAITFNHLNYNQTESDLAETIGLPDDIYQDFSNYLLANEKGFDFSPILNQNILKIKPIDPNQIKDINVEQPPTKYVNNEGKESYRLVLNKTRKLRKTIKGMLEEGAESKMWYENSAEAILEITNGDKADAEILLRLIAVTSQGAPVDTNFSWAIKAYLQHKAGEKINVGRFPNVMRPKLEAILRGEPFDGKKTAAFYENLSYAIKNYGEGESPVTVDLWMQRAFGFAKDNPTDAQYREIQDYVNEIAEEYGWTGHQAQAAIWTSVKARWEEYRPTAKKFAERKKWMVRNSEGQLIFNPDMPDAKEKFHEHMLKKVANYKLKEDIEGYDYADAVNKYKARINSSTLPSANSGVFSVDLKKVNGSDIAEYDYDIRQIFMNADGTDLLAEALGLPSLGIFDSPGSSTTETVIPIKGNEITEESIKLLKIYGAIWSDLTGGGTVMITKNMPQKVKKRQNVVAIEGISGLKNITEPMLEAINNRLKDLKYNISFSSYSDGFVITNMDQNDSDGNVIDQKEFKKDVEEIVETVLKDVDFEYNLQYLSSATNSTKINPEELIDGKTLEENISELEQSDLIQTFIGEARDDIRITQEKYNDKWSDPAYTSSHTSEESVGSYQTQSYRLTQKTKVTGEEQNIIKGILETIGIQKNIENLSLKQIDNEDFKSKGGWDWWKKIAWPISTRLKNINPKLKKVLRDYDFAVHTKTKQRFDIVTPFVDGFNALDPAVKDEIDLALKNQDFERVSELLEENNPDMVDSFRALTNMLEDIYVEAEEAGIDMGYIENYFPRQLIDRAGLMEYLGRENPDVVTFIEQEIKKANAKLKEKENRWLTKEEEDDIITSILQGNRRKKGKPSYTKGRTDLLIDSQINQFYKNPIGSLVDYISSMTEFVEQARFYGDGNATGPMITDYVKKLVDEKAITPEQESEVIDLLTSRFRGGGPGAGMQSIKNVTYIMTMGSPTSAITQIGDLAWAIDQSGLFTTLETAAGDKSITVDDVGIVNIAEEFGYDIVYDDKGEYTFVEKASHNTSKAVNKVFKGIGLTKMDRLGKETLMNSALKKYKKIIKKMDEGKKLGVKEQMLVKRMNEFFDGDVNDVINDLRGDEITENIQVLMFNTLAEHQPINLSEMPQQYADMDNGRIMYMLKSFTVKQIDVFRNQHLDMVTNGKTPKERAYGRAQLLRLAMIFAATNGSADAIKDLFMGRPVHLSDIAVENVWRLFGMSRYNYYQFERHGLYEGAYIMTMPPPVGVANTVYKDGKDLYNTIFMDKEKKLELEEKDLNPPFELQNMRTWKYVPGLGKFWYWHGGGGRKIINEDERKDLLKKIKSGKANPRDYLKYERYLDQALDQKLITQENYERKLKELEKY